MEVIVDFQDAFSGGTYFSTLVKIIQATLPSIKLSCLVFVKKQGPSPQDIPWEFYVTHQGGDGGHQMLSPLQRTSKMGCRSVIRLHVVLGPMMYLFDGGMSTWKWASNQSFSLIRTPCIDKDGLQYRKSITESRSGRQIREWGHTPYQLSSDNNRNTSTSTYSTEQTHDTISSHDRERRCSWDQR